MMLNYLYTYNIPVVVVATKLDKIKKSQMAKNVMDISGTLKIGKENIIVTSSQTRYGKDKVLAKMEQLIQNFVRPVGGEDKTQSEVQDENLGN